jgi:alpha-L-fucosidase
LLTGLAAWMKVNAQAIHGTRPWKIFGEGPTNAKAGAFHESGDYTSEDIRFTTKKGALYAILLDWPKGPSAIKSLGRNAVGGARVERVELLGGPRLDFRQDADALRLKLPAPSDGAFIPAIRIQGQGLV